MSEDTTAAAGPDYGADVPARRAAGRRRGGRRRIGREVARALAAQGAQVVCADLDEAAAKETARGDGDLSTYRLDVLDRDAVRAPRRSSVTWTSSSSPRRRTCASAWWTTPTRSSTGWST